MTRTVNSDEERGLRAPRLTSAGVAMTTTSRERRTWRYQILVLIVLGWFAMPYASQDNANEGFILFSTDRDNPDTHETCPACEEIYMMPADGVWPDGSGPTRITDNNYNDKAPVWSHS